MSLEPLEQILAHLRSAKNVLLVTRANPSPDDVAAALAFYLLLKKQGKKATIAIDNAALRLASNCAWLPHYQDIATAIGPDNRLTITFDLRGQPVRGITYSIKNGQLAITMITNGERVKLGPPDIAEPTYPFDLIVSLGSPDLESLGRLYDNHTTFFYEVPLINIDHQAENEHFGELNLVELTAVATTEVVYNLMEVWDKNLIGADIATCLLTGIISESNSFQSTNITPRTLAIASELITLGGRREQIAAELYGNKPITALQLWGRILAGLHTEPECGLLWSAVKSEDFSATQTTELDLHNIIHDLLTHAPQAKTIALFFPRGPFLKAVIHTHHLHFDLRKIFAPLAARGSRNLVECDLTTPMVNEAIAIIKETLIERAPRENPLPKF